MLFLNSLYPLLSLRLYPTEWCQQKLIVLRSVLLVTIDSTQLVIKFMSTNGLFVNPTPPLSQNLLFLDPLGL